MKVDQIISEHEKSGYYLAVNGIRTFLLDEGKGDPVLCLHGVPASSYLYRKVVPALARKGLRGLALDLPGLGLADRPDDFDYSWSSLSRFVESTVETLGLDRFHLVIHDIGGPVGMMMAARIPQRIRSLTVLNTMPDPDTFRRPWMMAPFANPALGPIWLASMNRWILYLLFRHTGVRDFSDIPRREIYAYLDLLKRSDGGRAFLKIMKGFELTKDARIKCHKALSEKTYPIRLIWGMNDRGLRFKKHGRRIMEIAGLNDYTALQGKHFLQEDNWDEIADCVVTLAGRTPV